MFKRLIRHCIAPISTVAALSFCLPSYATIVEFQLSHGESIKINLFDETTPETVDNFLAYVNDGAYTGAIIHRSVSDFVLQGGGFTFDGESIQAIASNAAVVNEPIYSNLRGTIAMAKTASSINSATNQWFFNLADNSSNLDQQNGGFTVFGQVVEGDMAKVDLLAALSKCNAGAPFDSLPVIDFDCSSTASIATENLVTINSVVIIDSSEVTADSLTPVKNTLINATPSTPDTPTDSNDDSGGGSVYWLLSLLASGMVFRKLTK
jgi:cyclophilin family peptidyl-prolyl cis-trans isomerase